NKSAKAPPILKNIKFAHALAVNQKADSRFAIMCVRSQGLGKCWRDIQRGEGCPYVVVLTVTNLILLDLKGLHSGRDSLSIRVGIIIGVNQDENGFDDRIIFRETKIFDV